MHIVTVLIILLGIITSSIGLLYTTGGKSYYFLNQYGHKVKMYGDRLYAREWRVFSIDIWTTITTIIEFLSIAIMVKAFLGFKKIKKDLDNEKFNEKKFKKKFKRNNTYFIIATLLFSISALMKFVLVYTKGSY